MTSPLPAPDVTPPLRVLLLGAATEGWYRAPDEERRKIILPRLLSVMRGWQGLGARLLASFDDDVLKVGLPQEGAATWFLIYEVPSLQVVSDMLHSFRLEEGGARLDRWFRLEARPGRAFFPVEPGPDA